MSCKISSTHSSCQQYHSKKWCFMSMCLVLKCSIWFFSIFIALLMLYLRGIVYVRTPKSLSYYFIHKSWEHHEATTTYSSTVVVKDTQFCFFVPMKLVSIQGPFLTYIFDQPKNLHTKYRHKKLDQKRHLKGRRGPCRVFPLGILIFAWIPLSVIPLVLLGMWNTFLHWRLC